MIPYVLRAYILIYRLLITIRINFFNWFRTQQILVGVFISSVLYIAVFGLLLSRIINPSYIIYIVPGLSSIYASTLTIIPVGTLIHVAMGRSGYYSYILPMPRWSIVAIRIIVGLILKSIALVMTIASYWILVRSLEPKILVVFIPAIALATAISLLYASLAFIIGDAPRYFTLVPAISTLLIILSTAYYPVSALPQAPLLRIAVDINPLSLASDIARIALGISEGDLVTKILAFIAELILIMAISIKILDEKLRR